MLHLLNGTHNRIGSFGSYAELTEYIHNSQLYQLRRLYLQKEPQDSSISQADLHWRFVHYKHSDLKIIYSCMKEPPLKGIEKQAFEHGYDLVEITKGYNSKLEQIPVTSDVDILSLQKDWCQEYCKKQGYFLIEDPDTESSNPSQDMGGKDDLVI